jgi:hypothetical protein
MIPGLSGRLRPKLKADLEREGLVLIEEGLRARVRYERFKMPGRRFHGKVTGERVGIGISEKRVAVFCRWGFAKLVNSEYSNPNLHMLDLSVEGDDKVVFRIDYDRSGQDNVSGVIKIEIRTDQAGRIVDELERRLRRSTAGSGR